LTLQAAVPAARTGWKGVVTRMSMLGSSLSRSARAARRKCSLTGGMGALGKEGVAESCRHPCSAPESGPSLRSVVKKAQPRRSRAPRRPRPFCGCSCRHLTRQEERHTGGAHRGGAGPRASTQFRKLGFCAALPPLRRSRLAAQRAQPARV